jgi:hypothetical protein
VALTVALSAELFKVLCDLAHLLEEAAFESSDAELAQFELRAFIARFQDQKLDVLNADELCFANAVRSLHRATRLVVLLNWSGFKNDRLIQVR